MRVEEGTEMNREEVRKAEERNKNKRKRKQQQELEPKKKV